MRFFDLIRKNDNYKVIIGIVVGAIIFGGGVYAANVSGSDVSYKNSSSGLDATNVQKAVDAIYEKAKTKGIPSPSSFSTDSWSTIALAAKMSKYPYQEYPYKVGDTKTVDMGSLGTHTVRIANLTTCSYSSQTACGFVIEFTDLLTTYSMASSGTNVGGWASSDLRKYLNDTLFKSLPDTLQQIIIKTTVVSGHGSTDKYNNSSTDKLYLLSSTEVWGSSSSGDTASSTTRQLDYYKNKGVTTSNYSVAIKKANGSSSWWWLRSASSNYSNCFFIVGMSGEQSPQFAGNTYWISPAFRIA